jgi:hypothetical protein
VNGSQHSAAPPFVYSPVLLLRLLIYRSPGKQFITDVQKADPAGRRLTHTHIQLSLSLSLLYSTFDENMIYYCKGLKG